MTWLQTLFWKSRSVGNKITLISTFPVREPPAGNSCQRRITVTAVLPHGDARQIPACPFVHQGWKRGRVARNPQPVAIHSITNSLSRIAPFPYSITCWPGRRFDAISPLEVQSIISCADASQLVPIHRTPASLSVPSFPSSTSTIGMMSPTSKPPAFSIVCR